jgi:DNA-binding NtrC family response regulator
LRELSHVELINRALDVKSDLIPIILTGYTDVETLVDAINLGRIYRYIPKPFDSRGLRMAMRSAIETLHLTRENVRLADENRRLVEELRAANDDTYHDSCQLLATADRPEVFAGVCPSED